MKTKTVCISIAESPRRRRFQKTAEKLGVDFEFVDATTRQDLLAGLILDNCTIDITDLSWATHEQHDVRRSTGPLGFGEIGCAYSHIRCWQMGRAEDLDFLVVFEDDAALERALEPKDFPDNDVDMLYLSNRMPSNEDGETWGYGAGLEGYILSRNGMRKALRILEKLYMPIDLQVLAHHESQGSYGHGLTKYRRNEIDQDSLLKARVLKHRVCRNGFGSSTVFRQGVKARALFFAARNLESMIGGERIVRWCK
jgi:GR25 family glycosyltransferase involved in LPS biosynthesis